MLEIALQRASGVPLYRQVVEQVAELIDSGALPPGTRLPTVRELARSLGLTRLTVHSAFTELQARGLIESHVGRGSFVAARVTSALLPGAPARSPVRWQAQGVLADLIRLGEQPDMLSFAQATPAAETYPTRELSNALRAAAADVHMLGYGPIAGDPELREHISTVVRKRGVVASPDEMLITAGTQQGIDLVLRALSSPGDVLLVEAPTYPGMLEAAARRGQRVVSVPVDDRGIDISAVEAACSVYHPRLLYTVPTHHNPTGTSLAADRRPALLRLARAFDLLIVEDDVYGLLGYDGATPLALKAADSDGCVIYCTSFSKTLAPGLRLGVLIAAPEHLPELADAKHSADLVCSPVLQRALTLYLRRGLFPAHLQQVRTLYRARRDALLAALAALPPGCTWREPRGGLNLWLTLPEGILAADERAFCSEAMQRGVALAPGRAFLAQPQHSAFVRLSFGALPPERIQQGIAIVGDLLRDHLRQRSARVARASRESVPLV